MTDEAAFLATIAADPTDRTARLVYADWLDDQADPRAELVRIEEEQRTLPATADRYWALKPRRNELRAGCDADWLRAMGYGRPNPTAFAEWPADVRGRWRFVREYVEQQTGAAMPDAGIRAAEAYAIEQRLGRPLPPSIREWVAFALDVQDRIDAGELGDEAMRDGFEPDTIHLRDDLPVLQLLIQAEGDIVWGTVPDDLARDDPPVGMYYLEVGRGVWERRPIDIYGSVAEFALGYELTYIGRGVEDWPIDLVPMVRSALGAEV